MVGVAGMGLRVVRLAEVVDGVGSVVRHHFRSYRLRRMMAKALAVMVTASRTMIAAEVSARNSSCGLRAQSKTMTGRAVYGPDSQSVEAAAAREGAEDGPDQDQRRGLAEGA